jgi:hypothetical protein
MLNHCAFDLRHLPFSTILRLKRVCWGLLGRIMSNDRQWSESWQIVPGLEVAVVRDAGKLILIISGLG